jgi:hypothetical protein
LPVQTLLKIGLPEGVLIYPAQFREWLAQEPNMPPVLFHRNPETNNPSNGLPGLLTVGGKQWLGILAQPGHEDVLYSVMGAAVKRATTGAGKSVKVEVQQIEMGVSQTQYPVKYWVREMAIKRRGPKSREMDINELVKERLFESMQRYADRYGLDLPTAEQLEIDVDVLKSIGLQLRTTKGITNEFVTLVDAELSIFADLQGHWMVGNLTARGYGRVGRDLKALAVHFNKEQTAERYALR